MIKKDPTLKISIFHRYIISLLFVYLFNISLGLCYGSGNDEDVYISIDLTDDSLCDHPKYSSTKSCVSLLCLDGGGIRSVAEVAWLDQMEKATNRPISQLFDMIGGTSAGGMIAAALTTPANSQDRRDKWFPKFSAADLIVELETNASKMFDKNWLSIAGLLGPRYKTSSLQGVMSHLFGDTTFNKSLTLTMVNAYNLNTQEPKFFRSWENEEIFRTQDIAVATGSAPSYFTPYSLSPINKTEAEVNYKLIDGGMIVNSSAECLLIEAKKLFPYAKEFNIVSLGTGKFQLPLSYNTLKTAGLLTWAQKAPAIALSSQPTLTDYIMKETWGSAYSRWNPALAFQKSGLDDIRKEQLDYLKTTVYQMIEERQDEFDDLAARLAVN